TPPFETFGAAANTALQLPTAQPPTPPCLGIFGTASGTSSQLPAVLPLAPPCLGVSDTASCTSSQLPAVLPPFRLERQLLAFLKKGQASMCMILTKLAFFIFPQGSHIASGGFGSFFHGWHNTLSSSKSSKHVMTVAIYFPLHFGKGCLSIACLLEFCHVSRRARSSLEYGKQWWMLQVKNG
ncbi:unnamed protein product, partial [Prunus brigantina]